MKTLSLLSLVLLCIACGSDKPDMTKMAVTGGATPYFYGIVDATKGSDAHILPPWSLLYVQNFELDVNNRKMVKVYFPLDSTEGYVPKDFLMEGGTRGVVIGSEANPVVVYDDEEGQVLSGVKYNEVEMVTFKPLPDGASQILYVNPEKARMVMEYPLPIVGYLKTPVISDSVSMAFYMLYLDANLKMTHENNPAPMAALVADASFNDLPLRQALLGSARGESLAGDNHTEMKWMNEDGKVLTGDEIPGTFALHYIWDDKTESDGNHLGDKLEQGTPDCGENKSALGYKLLFTPNKKFESVSLVCTIPMIVKEEGPRQIEFKDVEPGTTYELEVLPKVYGVVCDETTVTVQTNLGHHGEGMVHASCGD